MPRALHVLGALDPGGVERWLRDTVRYQDDPRWRFDFCLLGPKIGSYAPQLEALGCRLLRCPLAPRTTFATRLFALLLSERYEVVHSHLHLFSGVVLAVSRAAGVPVRAAHSHTCDSGAQALGRRLYRLAMQKLLARSTNLGFACSPQAAAFGGEGLRARLRLLPCGIDLRAVESARADRALLRRQLGLPEDAPVIGHVGRLEPEKNQGFLLRVTGRVIERIPRARLVIVGGGRLDAELKAEARRLGLRQRIIFTGPRDDIADLLGAFDAFALPSRREGLPAAVLEAQAAGLPAVVSDQTPSEAVVLPESIERVPLSRGVSAWAGALCRALSRPRGDRDIACQRLRQKGFDVAGSFNVLTRAYEELLLTTRPPATRPEALRLDPGVKESRNGPCRRGCDGDEP